ARRSGFAARERLRRAGCRRQEIALNFDRDLANGLITQPSRHLGCFGVGASQRLGPWEYAIRNTQYAIRNTQYAIRNTQYAIRDTRYAIRDTRYAIRNTQYAIRNTQSAIRNTQYAIRDSQESQDRNAAKTA
ncbi:MAG: hypothetical protein WAV84_09490, partial [Bacteroidota bacterium]